MTANAAWSVCALRSQGRGSSGVAASGAVLVCVCVCGGGTKPCAARAALLCVCLRAARVQSLCLFLCLCLLLCFRGVRGVWCAPPQVPYTVYAKYILPVLLPLLKETAAPTASTAAAATGTHSDEEGEGAGAGGDGGDAGGGAGAPVEARRSAADRLALGLTMLRKWRSGGEGDAGGVYVLLNPLNAFPGGTRSPCWGRGRGRGRPFVRVASLTAVALRGVNGCSKLVQLGSAGGDASIGTLPAWRVSVCVCVFVQPGPAEGTEQRAVSRAPEGPGGGGTGVSPGFPTPAHHVGAGYAVAGGRRRLAAVAPAG